MAQWSGQFTGRTHATRVADVEATLRQAIAVYKAAGDRTIKSKGKAVRRLVSRLYAARLRALRATRVAHTPLAADADDPRVDVEVVRRRELAIVAEGVAGVLAEFGVSELIL